MVSTMTNKIENTMGEYLLYYITVDNLCYQAINKLMLSQESLSKRFAKIYTSEIKQIFELSKNIKLNEQQKSEIDNLLIPYQERGSVALTEKELEEFFSKEPDISIYSTSLLNIKQKTETYLRNNK
jgi:hypothetical protein